ncbi:MAG: glutamate-1-semialdehyde 2,1-aminomutase [Chloroflexi bacterium]|nr:glutamate-1-semialdehyde 2,1-aminomutase [Chloroflexota bacterium]
MQTTNSQRLYEAASEIIPGGVNSPARAWGSVGGDPLFFTSGTGSKITDVDGNTYIDYVCSWGPLILGHSHPAVVEAAQAATRSGASFGAPTEYEVEAAGLVVGAVPSIEMVRFVNSGTEASMSAMRLARAATDRDMILKFDGGYHGHDDALLVRAGSGLASQGIADSAGVNSKLAADTLVAPYNDLAAVEKIFAAYRERLACVIIEPIGGNMGVVPADRDFLQGLRRITRDDGCLLIFDEVISGFRAAYGGAQEVYGIEPDITCLGKTIGGGFPVGAYGGSKELMSHVAPLGAMYQAGTLSGNPVAMAAGAATMRELAKPGVYEELARKTERLADGLRGVFAELEVPFTINQVCGMLTVFFGVEEVTDMDSASKNDREMFSRFFHSMLENGVYLPPSPFEAWFVSLAHGDEDIDATVEAARRSL